LLSFSELEMPGSGQVRFNPNLYNDGKVCISLLGTTSAANETQRWNPNESSLAQVLGSIQSQILGVTEPYFNEGFGHEMMRNTSAGVKGSKRYNNDLRLECLRHAIIDYVKCPPQGFEEVTRLHFSLCRQRLLVQARLWTREAQRTPKAKRFERAYCELVELLSNPETFPCSEPALPPLEHDLQALLALDPPFSRIIVDKKGKLPTQHVSSSATTTATTTTASMTSSFGLTASGLLVTAAAAAAAGANTVDDDSYNPWAVASGKEEEETEQKSGKADGNVKGDDDDDDFYS
jgi:Ubiquitin-conjugating enzyme